MAKKFTVNFETVTDVTPSNPPPSKAGFKTGAKVNYPDHASGAKAQKKKPGVKYNGNPWNLTDGRNILTDAADFYLLSLLNFAEMDEGKYQVHLETLTEEFAAYTDMAIGGEVRHSTSRVQAKTIPRPLREALQSGLIPKHRHTAWANWLYFRQQHGTIAIKWARDTFNQDWGGGYGGPLWANIADALWRFERGEFSPVTFVDTCFGLEHNGGCYFNKAHTWEYGGIKGILDLNLAGKYSALVPRSSQYVQQLINANITDLKDLGVWE